MAPNAAGSAPVATSTRSLFGASAPMPGGSLAQRGPVSIFSGSIGQQSQHPATVPGVRISVNELRPTTRFNDLHEELQKTIEFVDAFVLNKIQWQEQCEASSDRLDDLSTQIPPDVDHLVRSLESVQHALETDAEAIQQSKILIKSDAQDAKLSFKAINNLKLPQQFHHGHAFAHQSNAIAIGNDELEAGASRNLVEFFSKQTDDMAQTLTKYNRNIHEVETYLRDVELNIVQQIQQSSQTRGMTGVGDANGRVRELVGVLREFEQGILNVATKVGEAREVVQDTVASR